MLDASVGAPSSPAAPNLSGFSKKVDSTSGSSSSASCSRIAVLDRPDSPYELTPAAEGLRGRDEPEPTFARHRCALGAGSGASWHCMKVSCCGLDCGLGCGLGFHNPHFLPEARTWLRSGRGVRAQLQAGPATTRVTPLGLTAPLFSLPALLSATYYPRILPLGILPLGTLLLYLGSLVLKCKYHGFQAYSSTKDRRREGSGRRCGGHLRAGGRAVGPTSRQAKAVLIGQEFNQVDVWTGGTHEVCDGTGFRQVGEVP